MKAAAIVHSDLAGACLTVHGARLVPDPSGGLYWPEQDTLVVADLHFEKGSGFATRGRGVLPPYDTRATLGALAGLCRRFRPRRVVCLGDSFHDRKAEARLGPDEREMLHALVGRHDWIWICGNHDPAPDFAGRIEGTISLGPLIFRHAPSPGPMPGEVAGHLHPSAAISVRGHSMRRRCFAADGARLVLPAFGAYAGGLDVRDPAFATLFDGPFHAWMLGRRAVHPVRFAQPSRPRPGNASSSR